MWTKKAHCKLLQPQQLHETKMFLLANALHHSENVQFACSGQLIVSLLNS